jgi:hypothetical protein
VDEGLADSDGDGLADCVDPDDDNDGVPDDSDAFPFDPAESVDADGDGIGDNADPDDDNDGAVDGEDNCPALSNPSQADCNSDGLGDACEVASGAADTDANGVPDTCQDCNQDGIFDPLQAWSGQLADYDSNQVPDCCEQGVDCELGRYPVRWRTEDGGTGHYYLIVVTAPQSWYAMRDAATALGGYLASIRSAEENAWIWNTFDIVNTDDYWVNYYGGPLFGGFRLNYDNPWTWVSGEEWEYSNFGWGSNDGAHGTQFIAHTPYWDDVSADAGSGPSISMIVEWSADCNDDGDVDYGQILRGEIADADANGIPDTCEEPPCDADIDRNGVVDATDLAMVLSQWGISGGSPSADVTGDGMVEGKDLAIVVSAWGPCSSDPG